MRVDVRLQYSLICKVDELVFGTFDPNCSIRLKDLSQSWTDYVSFWTRTTRKTRRSKWLADPFRVFREIHVQLYGISKS